jgi:hypothetical protein
MFGLGEFFQTNTSPKPPIDRFKTNRTGYKIPVRANPYILMEGSPLAPGSRKAHDPGLNHQSLSELVEPPLHFPI